MDKNILKKEIRMILSSLQNFMKLMPSQRASNTMTQIQGILKNIKNDEDPAELNNIFKELKYKYNFLKLAYPKINQEQLSEVEEKPSEPELDDSVNMVISSYFKDFSNLKAPTSSTIDNNSAKEPIRGDSEESKGDNPKVGTFVLKDGKLVSGEAKKRSFVDFSNWYAANVDPEDLKRHKELLDRQHFKGPVWDGGGPPPSVIDEENPQYDMSVKGETNPHLKKAKEASFAKVKR